MVLSGAMTANDDSRREQRKRHDGQKKNEVAGIKDALLKALEVGHHAEGGDGFDEILPEADDVGEKIGHRRVADQYEQQTNHHGKNEADDLVAGHGRSHASDGKVGAREQETAEVAGENNAGVRAAEVV